MAFVPYNFKYGFSFGRFFFSSFSFLSHVINPFCSIDRSYRTYIRPQYDHISILILFFSELITFEGYKVCIMIERSVVAAFVFLLLMYESCFNQCLSSFSSLLEDEYLKVKTKLMNKY